MTELRYHRLLRRGYRQLEGVAPATRSVRPHAAAATDGGREVVWILPDWLRRVAALSGAESGRLLAAAAGGEGA